jgi:hypothetical protein
MGDRVMRPEPDFDWDDSGYCVMRYKGFRITAFPDHHADSPREWSNLCTMVCWHRRYSLGDKHDFETPQDFEEYWREHENEMIVLPLYLYDHSGITISTSHTYPYNDRWDAGQVGWIYVEYSDIRREMVGKYITKKKLKRAEEILHSEVEVYDEYLRGEVYGFVVEDKDDETVDSCWGYYGSDFKKSGLFDTAFDSLEWEIEKRRKERINQIKTWIRNRVPLSARKFDRRLQLCQ